MSIYHEVHRLHRLGFNNSQIERKVGIHRDTVREYLKKDYDTMSEWVNSLQNRTKKLDPYAETIVGWLKEHNDLSAAQIEDWLLEEHPELRVSSSSVRSYLYSGGASLLYVLTTYFHNSKNCDWQLLRTLLKTLEVPTTHTYGIGYGMSGVALIIMMILILPNVPLDVRQRLELLLMDKIEYIIIHFHDNKDFKGFYDEKQAKFIDDFGNGTLGILKILKMFLKYNDKELCWDEDVFSLIPLPNTI